MEGTMKTTFVPEWRTAGEDTREPKIGAGRLEGEYDDTAIRIVLEFAKNTDGGVDRWIFQLPEIANWMAWNPNGEARAVDAADQNHQHIATAVLDRMKGTIECWAGSDSIGWGNTYPFTWTPGCAMYILFMPRGRSIPRVIPRSKG
jgi:hypothetical protein